MASDSYWGQPFVWARAAAKAGERRRVFCSSTSDVLEVPADPPTSLEDLEPAADRARTMRDLLHHARERLWPIIADTAYMCGGCGRPCAHSSDTPRRRARILDLASVGTACRGRMGRCLTTPVGGLDWLLLTKRPENWKLVPAWLRPLVWLGTSASGQRTLDEWGGRLLQAEGFRVRFLSLDPLVEAVNLRGLLLDTSIPTPALCACGHGHGFTRCPNTGGVAQTCHRQGCSCPGFRKALGPTTGIHWVVCGGESGPKARPLHPEWVRAVRDQCQAAGVSFLFKQWGEWLPVAAPGLLRKPQPKRLLMDTAGNTREAASGDMLNTAGEWWGFERVGKKQAGRLLDGRLHDDYPTDTTTRCTSEA